MVGALLSVGNGKIESKDILWMLNNPSEQNWIQKCSTMNPEGLYLQSIRYATLNILRGPLS